MAITGTGFITWIPNATQVGNFPITVTVTDNKSPPVEQSFTITVKAANVTVPDVVGQTQAAAQTAITGANLTVGTITQASSATVPAGNVISQNPAANASVAKNTAIALEVSTGPASGGGNLPPDPATVAPPIDPTVATTTFAATQFLYTGNNPIQTGVAQGTIEAKRAAVIRGKVMDKTNAPLSGVTITILNHPEFGQTLSRADGMFDMVVNGGSPLVINYKKQDYFPAQRQVDVPWQDYVIADNAILIQPDSKLNTIDLTNATQDFQVAQGSSVTDNNGSRTAELLIPKGTQANVLKQDGSTLPISQLHLRITEYTLGNNGPKAMPGPLPPTSGYTYAVEITSDEAIAKIDGRDVIFDRPVSYYVDNFLNMPIGIQVPVGYYDPAKSAWIPSSDGRVIKILSIANGEAQIDSDGDAVADGGSSIGMTLQERNQLALLHTAGTSLWRVPMTHLSTYDLNYGEGCKDDCKLPQVSKPKVEEKLNVPCITYNSIIECENQTLGEALPVTGTPFSLNYRSDRVKGRTAANMLTIPLSGASVPTTLKSIALEINIAGRKFLQIFPATANQTYSFNWDGKDALGRELQGSQFSTVRIGYVYDGYYNLPPAIAKSFGAASGVLIPGDIKSRDDVILWQEQTVLLGGIHPNTNGLGAWSLSMHHSYDPVGKILYYGDGSHRSSQAETNSGTIDTFAGGGNSVNGIGDGGPATSATFFRTQDVAVGPDGSVYISDTSVFGNDSLHDRIRRVDPNGIITTVAGGGNPADQLGDGGLAINAKIATRNEIAIAPDGSLYIMGGERIRRVGFDGVIKTVAGGGQNFLVGKGEIATNVSLFNPSSLAFGKDGSLFFYSPKHNSVISGVTAVEPDSIYHVELDGTISRIANVEGVSAIDVARDGSIYFSTSNGGLYSIRRINPSGITTTVLNGLQADDFTIGTDSNLYAVGTPASFSSVIKRLDEDGTASTVAGNGIAGLLGGKGDGGPATAASFNFVTGLALGPDGSLYASDFNDQRIRRVRPTLPGLNVGDLIIPSEDGSQTYIFNNAGRHLRTVDSLTKTELYNFSYDSSGRLVQITDLDGKNTSIERDAQGNPTAIVAPFGQRTNLALDTNGYLGSVSNPASETYAMTYTADGLLTKFEDPRSNASTMTYDSFGRLAIDTNAENGAQSLARLETPSGFQVDRTSGEGHKTSYLVDKIDNGAQRRRVIHPDGTLTDTQTNSDGSSNTTEADGTVTSLQKGPDPRFGMLSPIVTNANVNSGGLTLTATGSRTVSLANPSDPLSLTGLTDTITVNGRKATRTYVAATKTITSTSPANRVSTAVLDAKGRVTQAQVTGLLPANASYDTQGRLITITQGTGIDERKLDYSYNPQGYLASVLDPLGRQVQFPVRPSRTGDHPNFAGWQANTVQLRCQRQLGFINAARTTGATFSTITALTKLQNIYRQMSVPAPITRYTLTIRTKP